ncbi:MAG: hypothetical protein IJU40_06150 [Desulfovibrionaceae bacterium]|nr:hypothetical protein [Desulfovibrionaceae bacterium]
MLNPMSSVIEQRIFSNRVKNLDNLVCSRCGSINIHIQSVLVCPGLSNDESQLSLEVNIVTGKLSKGKQSRNKSSSKKVLSFICNCDHCHGFSRFDIMQHKDEEYVKIYPVDSDSFEENSK